MWPSEYIELKRIEDLLTCGICYEYMDTSVVTLCSHNYCSLCIRKYLHYKTQCPACFSETFEKDLRKNKVLDEIILHFSEVKKKLQKCPQNRLSVNNNNEYDGGDKLKSVKKNSTMTNFIEKSVKDSPLAKNASPPCTPKSALKNTDSPSTSGQTNIALFFTPKSRKEIVQSENSKSVVCPVCKVPVPESNINKHLDDCLKRQQKQPQVKIEKPKRKPLPKLVFSLMKDSVIRKKLKELGLSSQGDRKTLELRLQKYIIVYNAECDKSSPRAVSEVIRQFEEEENNEKRAHKACSSATRLQINRNTEQNVIDEERKKYYANKSSFDHLVATIKENGSKKSSVRRSLLADSNHRESDSPQKRQAVEEKLKDTEDFDTNDFQPIKYDVSMEASDSDTSCPLQTYSSTDPLRCNIELYSGCENLNAENDSPDLFSRSSEKIDFSNDGIKFESDIDGRSVYLTNDSENTKYENTKICDSPKGSSSVQRRHLISKINAIQRMQCTIENDEEIVKIEESEENNISEQQVPQHIIYDVSSNDSVESNFNNENQISTLDNFVNKTANNFSSFEKENISSPVRSPGSRVTRKRNREIIHNATKTVSKRVKSTKVAVQTFDTAGSNNEDHVMSILHDTENGRPQKVSRKKGNQDSEASTEKTTAVLRKSGRTRFASKVPLK